MFMPALQSSRVRLYGFSEKGEQRADTMLAFIWIIMRTTLGMLPKYKAEFFQGRCHSRDFMDTELPGSCARGAIMTSYCAEE